MKKMYTPTQIGIGTYLGGPIAALYFLNENFIALDKFEISKLILKIGSVITFVLILALPFIPESLPNNLIPILYLIPVLMVVKKYQWTKNEILNSDQHIFQSNWKVFGMSLAFMAVFFAIAFVYLLAIESLGIITLA